MSKAVYKYELDANLINKGQVIHMPDRAEILDVQFKDSKLCLWALSNPEEVVTTPRTFYIAFTGAPFDMIYYKSNHIATLQHNGFVFHIFMEK